MELREANVASDNNIDKYVETSSSNEHPTKPGFTIFSDSIVALYEGNVAAKKNTCLIEHLVIVCEF